ncbi:hypothetical protein RhiJN_02235 [Ceratobasidium sp. AG-Ba]|nr:hypothetical protein RhiJN_02235 [Ceratobasidium sp. AG-Ba]
MAHIGIKSKDYSSFSNGHNALRQSIESNLTATESQLRAAEAAIRNPAAISKSSKVTKQVINSLLGPAKSASELLSSVAEAVPQAEPVAEVFKALLKLELDRQDNDKQIATLYHSMTSMLVVLAKLDDVFLSECELNELLDEKLDEIVKLLNEFGNFCDVYYKHRPVGGFGPSSFSTPEYNAIPYMKHELEVLISHRTTLAVLQTSDVVNSIASDVSELTRFMNAQTAREREAQSYIKSKGGVENILKNDKFLDEVAAKLGDNVTKSIQTSRSLQYSLHADLELQLKENQAIFVMKLQCVKDQIEESVNRSTTTILMKLDSGPHEIINDPDIKAIWKGAYGGTIGKWRNTVKSRHFVSAVHHYFEQDFARYTAENEGTNHPDTWTLNYLSRVIFYPAIADAIDEDSSGYVSLHELNHFFDARPPNWTTPQWLAYWAAGWYKDNLRYRDKIMARLGVFNNSIEGLHSENKEALKEYVESIEGGIKLIAESLYGDVLDYFEDDSDEVVELDALRDKYTEYVTGQVEQQLAKAKHQLDDKRTLSIVIGAGNRLESKILCVMHRLLKWHHKMFDIGKDKPLQDGITIGMVGSFHVIFDAFTARTRSLMESWRQQRMDVGLQAEWYANGLFEDWYKQEKDQPDDNDYDEEYLTDDEEVYNDDNELVEYATRPPTAVEADGDSVVEEPLVGDNQLVQEVQGEDNDDGCEEGAENEYQPENNENSVDDQDAGKNAAEDREREVDERLERLETGMKELKELMLRILERLE